MERPAVLLSIHDVMPATLPLVSELVDICCQKGLLPATLLVVPGHQWRDEQLDLLRQWEERGFNLAGHGWIHRAGRIDGWYHRLHSRLFSADVAEHLVLDQAAIEQLLHDNHRWFTAQGLSPPELYVPPAWAWGCHPFRLQDISPFRLLEALGGVYLPAERQVIRLPLLGFEAVTRRQAAALKLWNRSQGLLAAKGHPCRLAVHPNDLQCRLADELAAWLRRDLTCLDYRSLADSARLQS